ncbi:NRDE family protein [Blastococcus jejuensis]|uniref:NRDE family protein n=1 Tax=Blastococcus jejuensis TaxID=351224 RepID=A0ABP6NZH7_9ACTN
MNRRGGCAGCHHGLVCTVVVRWSDGRPPQILALRDELLTREFDDPGRWWPELPDVVGGRDRVAGGTWCATSIGTGATALVVNRPHKQLADPGAPSRGVLPLLAVEHGADWLSHVELGGMASFALLLATPHRVTTWDFDGQDLVTTEHPEGVHMLTSGGAENRKADLHLQAFAESGYPHGWRGLVQSGDPKDDPAALVVRHELDGLVFGTVFGELIEAAPGRLRLEYNRQPWTTEPWHVLAAGTGPP